MKNQTGLIQSCGLSKSFLAGTRDGSLAKNPNKKTPTKKKTTVYTEILRASIDTDHFTKANLSYVVPVSNQSKEGVTHF